MFASRGLFSEVEGRTLRNAYELAVGKLGATHVVDDKAKRKLVTAMFYQRMAESFDRSVELDPDEFSERIVRHVVSLNSMASRALK